ncbi:unnamed protein product, partial [Prunus brigantina]
LRATCLGLLIKWSVQPVRCVFFFKHLSQVPHLINGQTLPKSDGRILAHASSLSMVVL